MKDKTMGIISILVSLFLLFSLREKSFETKAFPVTLLLVLIILSLLLVIDKKNRVYEFKNIKKILLYYLLFFVYVLVMPYTGFIIGTTCFISVFLIMSKYHMSKIKVILFSLLASFIIWFIFSGLFRISLPEILF